MATILGIDVGTNSVGSAWVDTEKREIYLGVSVFPAGVEAGEDKRGAPKNQKRRQTRSQRHSIVRRAQRKRALRTLLVQNGFLPSDEKQLLELFKTNPWHLRREALTRALTPHEFGRILVHLNQRRGALGIKFDEDDKDADEQKVKDAMKKTREKMGSKTFGQFMADLHDERIFKVQGTSTQYRNAIRNRRDSFEWHAERALIHEEFETILEKQKACNSTLSAMLTEDFKKKLDDPIGDDTWLNKGVVFGQRRTYWNTGTLGRCDLEPTDRCCPAADMYAQEFRVLETANNIRVEERGKKPRPLNDEERQKVVDALCKQKTASVATIRRALGIEKKERKAFFTLNIERDPDREINTDWFYREIVSGAIGEDTWRKWDKKTRDSVNRAILKFDPDIREYEEQLLDGAQKWWRLDGQVAKQLVAAWKTRPKLEKRLNLSRRAIENLLPYMKQPAADGHYPTETEARQLFAEDADNGATDTQRARYVLGTKPLNKAGRHYVQKHQGQLPPAPMLSNPVVRKAIHEVRRHVNEYLVKFGRKPDYVVVELARDARQSAKVRNEKLSRDREREKIRKEIIQEHKLDDPKYSLNQQNSAVERVLLCSQQNHQCPYTPDKQITEDMAAAGREVEIDHILPRSRGGNNWLSNKVLCFIGSNQNKADRTPKEWLSDTDFQQLERRLAHLNLKRGDKPIDKYFSRKDYVRKWENLHSTGPNLDEFAASQLNDTAYASRQVAAWLKSALYTGEGTSHRSVLTTKGTYTAILRRDWGLLESNIDSQWHGIEQPKPDGEREQRGIARKGKDRTDHRHHAIDALVVALTDAQRIKDVAHHAEEQEKARANEGKWPSRKPLPPPWGNNEAFRQQVLQAAKSLVVSHVPQTRIAGAFHDDKPMGRSEKYPGMYKQRTPASNLKPSNLRAPQKANPDDPWHTVGKGQNKVILDRGLRKAIRACLRKNGLDPDNFTEEDVKRLTQRNDYKLQLPSGIPIYTARVAQVLEETKLIQTKRGFFKSNTNHHIEIWEQNGVWKSYVVTTFEAAQRVHPPKGKRGQSLIQHSRKGFVMSLGIGEMVCMLDPATNQHGYFVVFKVDKDPDKIHFVHHWDARPSQERKDVGEREEIALSPRQLQATLPCKVCVTPTGEIRVIKND